MAYHRFNPSNLNEILRRTIKIDEKEGFLYIKHQSNKFFIRFFNMEMMFIRIKIKKIEIFASDFCPLNFSEGKRGIYWIGG